MRHRHLALSDRSQDSRPLNQPLPPVALCSNCDANPVYDGGLCEHCYGHQADPACECCGSVCGLEETPHGRLCESCCDNAEWDYDE